MPFNMLRFAVAFCASMTHAEVLEGIFDDLALQFHDMPNSVVEAAIANSLGKSLGIEGVPLSDVACVRDYSAACPEEWSDQGDGETCSAPMYYQGPCSNDLNFATLTPAEKRAKASACGSQFPCVDSCTMDFSSQCPDGGKMTVPTTVSFHSSMLDHALDAKIFEDLRHIQNHSGQVFAM